MRAAIYTDLVDYYWFATIEADDGFEDVGLPCY